MIRVKQLIKRFGLKTILRGIEFQVEAGEFVALLGPNGSGKTTLLRILSSLLTASSGEVVISGFKLPSQAGLVRQRIGFVSHQPLLYGDLTAEENLFFYSRMYNMHNPSARVKDILQMIGLENRRHDLVRTFSRGMQQRLAIGRAALHNPEVMLLDEPHTGLDQEACSMLDRLLMEIAARGHTVFLTSHDLSRVGDLASRFDILFNGVIVASISNNEITKDELPGFYRNAISNSGKIL